MFFAQLIIEFVLLVTGGMFIAKTHDIAYGCVILAIGFIGLIVTIYRYAQRNNLGCDSDCVPSFWFFDCGDGDCGDCGHHHHSLDCDGLDCGGHDCDCSH